MSEQQAKSKLQLRKASRQAAKIRVGFTGTSGSGKTIGALMVAYGLCGDWDKIAVIDTENGSADLYEHLGEYHVLPIHSFSPAKYIEAITACEEAKMEVIICDSMSHAWNYLIQLHDDMTGNGFKNWGPIGKQYEALKNKILQSPCHFFTTTRRKQEYEVVKEDGKTQVVKLGLKEVNKEGWEYELTLNFEIDATHRARASKDRTELFGNIPEGLVLSSKVGEMLRDWCNSAASDREALFAIAAIEINNCDNKLELSTVRKKYPQLSDHKGFLDLGKAKQEALNLKIQSQHVN